MGGQDDFYAYIAGYTPGGFAYGVTWEEWGQIKVMEKKQQEDHHQKDQPEVDEGEPEWDDEIPF